MRCNRNVRALLSSETPFVHSATTIAIDIISATGASIQSETPTRKGYSAQPTATPLLLRTCLRGKVWITKRRTLHICVQVARCCELSPRPSSSVLARMQSAATRREYESLLLVKGSSFSALVVLAAKSSLVEEFQRGADRSRR